MEYKIIRKFQDIISISNDQLHIYRQRYGRQVRHSTLFIIITLKMKNLNRDVSFVGINDECSYKYQRMSKGVIYFVYQEEGSM